MPIETKCTGCGRTLRVADEHAGKQARCPVCNAIYTVPGPVAGAQTSPRSASDSTWELKRDEQVYGPVVRLELDRWVAEGRVAANCLLRELPVGDWVAAGKIYPVLVEPPASTAAEAQNPFADLASSPAGQKFPAWESLPPPHRGGLILALGILSWFLFCPLFGILALILASADLRAMTAGRMDPSGKSLTQVGMVLGIAHLALFACMGMPFLLFLLVVVARAS